MIHEPSRPREIRAVRGCVCQALGHQLGLVVDDLRRWLIGDWLNHGERAYGDKHTETRA